MFSRAVLIKTSGSAAEACGQSGRKAWGMAGTDITIQCQQRLEAREKADKTSCSRIGRVEGVTGRQEV